MIQRVEDDFFAPGLDLSAVKPVAHAAVLCELPVKSHFGVQSTLLLQRL